MRSIIIDDKLVEYELNYTSKKNVNIRIRPNLTLFVSTPRWVTKSEMERILYKKSNWIIKNLKIQKVIQKNKKVNVLSNNHSIWYLGEKYRFYIRQSDTNDVTLTEDQIIVQSKKSDDIEYSKKVFLDWLRNQAKVYFTQSIDKYRNKMIKKGYNIPEYTLQIRSMKSRWGTCTPKKKKITLNLSLMYAEKEYLDYVALHELTHFIEIYHNKHFYEILSEFMPDYKIRQDTLNKEYSQINKQNISD